jgi:outer membrane protein, multidrug efflux system
LLKPAATGHGKFAPGFRRAWKRALFSRFKLVSLVMGIIAEPFLAWMNQLKELAPDWIFTCLPARHVIPGCQSGDDRPERLAQPLCGLLKAGGEVLSWKARTRGYPAFFREGSPLTKKYLFLVCILPLLLAGCALTPSYERPSPPMAPEFNMDGLRESPAAPAIMQLGWRQFFGDTRLHELLALAMENNRSVRVAIQRVEEARALYGIQRADQLPTFSTGVLGSRSRVPADLSLTGNARTTSQYQATLNLNTWELDFWGRVGNLKDAALESYLATEETRRAIQINLVAQVANIYLLERELDERLATATQTLATREESYRIMRRRSEEGAASKLDATQAEVLLNQALAELAILERQREQGRNALILLVGSPLDPEARPLSQIEATFVRDIAPGLPSDLLLNRPDVLAAEHRLKAAHANIGAARAAFFPRIALTGSVGSASSELEGLFDSGSHIWNFTPSLSLPIFDGGRNQANLNLAEARRHLAVADYEQTVQGAFREVADALADRRWLTRQVAVQQAILATQIERTRLANLRYQSGAASYLEVLDAERERFAAEQALVQIRRALLASAVNLYSAMGGGAAPQYQ